MPSARKCFAAASAFADILEITVFAIFLYLGLCKRYLGIEYFGQHFLELLPVFIGNIVVVVEAVFPKSNLLREFVIEQLLHFIYHRFQLAGLGRKGSAIELAIESYLAYRLATLIFQGIEEVFDTGKLSAVLPCFIVYDTYGISL